MKLEINQGTTKFEDIHTGDCFYIQGNYYMKIKTRDGVNTSVRLSTGMVESISANTYVLPVTAVVKLGTIGENDYA